MDFLPDEINNYAEAHTESESDLLQFINRDTHVNVMRPRMLSGHMQGRLLSMFSHMIKPKNILELGTYTGYSALCFAEGMQTDGKLITIDINEELEDRVRGYFAQSPYNDLIDYRIGKAADIIPALTETFDIVFIDADKINNALYYDLVFDKVNKGGYIIADNVLWSGKVVQDFSDSKIDKDTQAVLDFNKKVQEDSRVQNILLAIRDGLLIVRKL